MKQNDLPDMTFILCTVAVALAFLAGSAALLPVHAAETGCVKCHTSEKILKSLHKPVKVEVSEAVG